MSKNLICLSVILLSPKLSAIFAAGYIKEVYKHIHMIDKIGSRTSLLKI